MSFNSIMRASSAARWFIKGVPLASFSAEEIAARESDRRIGTRCLSVKKRRQRRKNTQIARVSNMPWDPANPIFSGFYLLNQFKVVSSNGLTEVSRVERE